jgi:hypothetical protein
LDASDGFDGDEIAALKGLIKPQEAACLLKVVEELRCLDPSVGSGAFPVGLLHELLNLRRSLRTAADGYVDPVRKQGHQWIQDTKAHIVENALYGVDIQQQAIEICRLRLWLSLIVDYDLGVDPLQADRAQFLSAIKSISQLPNLEMNFRRGDSLLDYISGIPVRVEGGVVSRYRDQVESIQKRGHELHKARRADKKKELRLSILADRFALAETVIDDQIQEIDAQTFSTNNWFGETDSDSKKKQQLVAARSNLEQAVTKIGSDRKDLEKLARSPLAGDFYPRLRKLEGADFDSPFNFIWNIDYAEIFTAKPISTVAGEFAIINDAQKQGELVLPGKKEVLAPQEKGGFDLVVGNPPFVTARNSTKRELYRERWARVCHMKFLLICPFFDLSFGLLRPKGQLGFIVSNAFAKREFGQPLIEKFFPTVNLQKIIDCSGLMFPGHGTPTCVVFGGREKPDDDMPVRIAAIQPGGGDLRTPPEESPLWHLLEKEHENPGYSDNKVDVRNIDRKQLSRWPWNFDQSAEETKLFIESKSDPVLRDFLNADVGFDTITAANDIFMIPSSTLRRFRIATNKIKNLLVGELFRNYERDMREFIVWPYSKDGSESELGREESKLLIPHREHLEKRSQFHKTQLEAGLSWFEYREYHRRALTPCLTHPYIATHIHFHYSENPTIFNQHCPVTCLTNNTPENNYLLCGLLNSSAALFWLKQVCFSKRESEEGAKDTYFEFAGGKVQQLPVPGSIGQALNGKPTSLADRVEKLASVCCKLGNELPVLALRKLFEKKEEAYQGWNSALPGYAKPASECLPAFTSSDELRKLFQSAMEARDERREKMIALQEEMDWLCYEAYGLISGLPKCPSYSMPENLRPFRLWAQAGGDFAAALKLIPDSFSTPIKSIWRQRLELIRDNEHVRRIEAPVYKRRWDEQWKVGNRWMAGPVAYAQELIDAFSWWLAEKAEWHMEHTAHGGPLNMDVWIASLWKDKRVAAAWPVIAESLNAVELWKASATDKKPGKPVEGDGGDFAKFLRKTIEAETIPNAIPPAVSWDDLKKKGVPVVQAIKVRGKLNVPRERFRQKKDGTYIWAGN